MRFAHILAALGCMLALAACGIKGPLYLPEIPQAPSNSLSGTDHSKQAANDRA